MLNLVGWLLTILDLVVSFLGSMGSIGIINLTDIITTVDKIFITVILFAINIVLPTISVGVLASLMDIYQNKSDSEIPKNDAVNKSDSEIPKNETVHKIAASDKPLSGIFEVYRKILLYRIIYPTVLILDIYTTFLGVGQLFILDELSKSTRVETLNIDFMTIIHNSSLEQLGFITGVCIILLTGHFFLAGILSENKSKSVRA